MHVKRKNDLHEIFLNLNTSVQRCVNTIFQNKLPHFLILSLCQKKSQLPGQNQ